jgi:hypothetical protein
LVIWPRFKRGKDTSATLSKSVIETLLRSRLDTMVLVISGCFKHAQRFQIIQKDWNGKLSMLMYCFAENVKESMKF